MWQVNKESSKIFEGLRRGDIDLLTRDRDQCGWESHESLSGQAGLGVKTESSL